MKNTVVILVLVLIAVGAGYYYYTSQGEPVSFQSPIPEMTDEGAATSDATLDTEPAELEGSEKTGAIDPPGAPNGIASTADEGAEDDQGQSTDNVQDQEITQEYVAEAQSGIGTASDAMEPVELTEVQIEAALEPRVLGDEDAPVKISEFSSFSCGHCGAFHEETFKALKEQYIDTGKAFLVFEDFPLNITALKASMVARCMPQNRYFDYVQLLFENQDSWAYSEDYKSFLKQNAMMAGLSGPMFEACFENEQLQNGILAAMREAQRAHEISSTPTFVINDEEKIIGNRPISDFQSVIDPLVE